MQVIATAKNLRVSPKKARLVVDQIKKMSPAQSLLVLDFVPQKSSGFLKKVIASAIANAKNNHNLSEESLVFKEIQVGKGMEFKRFRAVARGRAHAILKRTSHIRVILEGEEKVNKPAVKTQEKETKSETKEEKNGTKS